MPPDRTAIRDYMTPQPHTIAAGQTLHAAHQVMNALQVRHLPVLEGHQLVGMLSLRDLAMIEAVEVVHPDLARVADVMSAPAFVVSPDASLACVSEEMAARKLGAAVVVEGPSVVGIFTTVDALWALAEMSRERDAASAQPARTPA